MNKEIANVVFYKFFGENGNSEQACIFYTDGTTKNISLDEGIDIAYQLAAAEKINANQFRSMINKEKIYTMSGAEFKRRFHEFTEKSKKKPSKPSDGIAPPPTSDIPITPKKPKEPIIHKKSY